MLTKVQKLGDAQGVELPSGLLDEARISVGDEVDVTVERGRIVIAPAGNCHGKLRLQDVLVNLPADYQPSEGDWGAPVGREAW